METGQEQAANIESMVEQIFGQEARLTLEAIALTYGQSLHEHLRIGVDAYIVSLVTFPRFAGMFRDACVDFDEQRPEAESRDETHSRLVPAVMSYRSRVNR